METPDSSNSWLRLGVSLALSAVGGVAFWSAVVTLPAIQTDFGVTRAEASLPFTMIMIGYAGGGVLMGWLTDRHGIAAACLLGMVLLVAGYAGAAAASGPTWLALDHGLLIGVGGSAFLSPLMTDISHWFQRRRALAVTICSSGNYVAGALWPPVLQHFIAADGWRATHAGVAVALAVAMGPLIWMLRVKTIGASNSNLAPSSKHGGVDLPGRVVVVLLAVAGFSCCAAMSMPQAHLVAYCADLGYGPAKGAEMLSAMLGLGIVSRIGSGVVADKIGGLATLLIGSFVQGLALFAYLWFDSLASLYVISAMFGLFQGGIIPMYVVIIREYFPPARAGATAGMVMMATFCGMAAGGWMSGLVFDISGSYRLAFLNGLLWNLLNLGIVAFLMTRRDNAQMVPA